MDNQNKTQPTERSMEDFIGSLPKNQQDDVYKLSQIFHEETGYKPIIWGTSIIGFGSYHYTYPSGRTGNWLLTGFAPRKGQLTLYFMDGLTKHQKLLNQLGKHTSAKSCVYIKQFTDIDEDTLRKLIRTSVAAMKSQYPIR